MGRMDDERLTQFGNRLRRFANGETRSRAFVKEIEDYLLTNFNESDSFDDLKEPLASYSRASRPQLDDDSKLENVFRVALERISALCAGMGQAYLDLIDRYLARRGYFRGISFAVLANATQILRPGHVVRGQARPRGRQLR
jgi:hypothetical protein